MACKKCGRFTFVDEEECYYCKYVYEKGDEDEEKGN